MANVAISGDTSGAITLSAPAVAGTNTITLPASTGTLALTTSGTPVADYWYLTTSLSISSGTNTDITANLAKLNFGGTGVTSSAMTQSSGIFTFPQTGLYRVSFSGQFYHDSSTSRYLLTYIYVSTDSGSTYNYVCAGQGSIDAIVSASNTFQQVATETQINVTSTSTVKVKFQVLTQNICNLNGNGVFAPTFMSFTRLGNSV